MPTYDYVCTSCGHEMEVMHSVHGHGPAACPVCGSPMRKAISAPAFHFKGSGWARKERPSGRSSTPSPKDTGSGGTSTTDSTAAAPSGGTAPKDGD